MATYPPSYWEHLKDTDPANNPAPAYTLPPLVSVGYYMVGLLSNDPSSPEYNKAVVRDTRTGESGVFDADAVAQCLTDALDTFFSENF